MIDRMFLRERPHEVEKSSRSKGYTISLSDWLKLDQQYRKAKSKLDSLRSLKNHQSEAIARAKDQKAKKKLIDDIRKNEQGFDRLRDQLKSLEEQMTRIEKRVPNLPRPDVKIGKDEKENETLREVGERTRFAFPAKNYLDIAKRLQVIDLERAAKVSGTRFGYIKGELAELEFALVQYAFSVLVPEGFVPIIPPTIIREEAMEAMGYLAAPGDREMYYLERDQQYLVGTAEQSLGPMHWDEILDGQRLPLRYVGFSSCYRRESGSYGKDTKGIVRVHQFDKVEMFSFTKPEESDQEHEFLLSLEERLMQGLRLPYRVVKMVTGDLGFPAARKYDLETWLPGSKEFRETHSTSTCTDFQSRRLNIRYRDGKNSKFVHTLNGTAFAIGRTLVAIIENYQQADGSVLTPEALRPFLRFTSIEAK